MNRNPESEMITCYLRYVTFNYAEDARCIVSCERSFLHPVFSEGV